METTDIDDLLRRYSAAESRIAANMVELDDHPTYELMMSNALVGSTQARISDAVSKAASLWIGLDALRQTLERARALRGSGRLGRSDRAELQAILAGPSVLIGVVETSLAERDLLAEASVEQRVTIEQLVTTLREVYEPLRDSVAAIDQVWRDVLPRLDAADTTLMELNGELSELGASEPSVTRASDRLAQLRATVMDDPLSLDSHAGEGLDQAISAAALQVGSLRRAHDALAKDLARTEVLVADARTLRSRAAVAKAEAEAKVLDPQDLVQVPDDAAVDELARGGAALRHDRERPWQQTRAELDRWLSIAERMVAQLSTAEQRNRAPLEARSQLRGLLSAYRAKAAAVGLVELPQLSDLADEAHNELFTAPTDLTRAEALVSEFGLALQSGV